MRSLRPREDAKRAIEYKLSDNEKISPHLKAGDHKKPPHAMRFDKQTFQPVVSYTKCGVVKKIDRRPGRLTGPLSEMECHNKGKEPGGAPRDFVSSSAVTKSVMVLLGDTRALSKLTISLFGFSAMLIRVFPFT